MKQIYLICSGDVYEWEVYGYTEDEEAAEAYCTANSNHSCTLWVRTISKVA